ncbi:uncharacterized protein LOC143454754 isoform X1 [Clavelina lepadiformis]|uniref:uncharacterized protein LOC143454754 isoform X1 n=1 Tax=Clavelina lepadiformis TaxID=159417 RepID=UPI004042D0EE
MVLTDCLDKMEGASTPQESAQSSSNSVTDQSLTLFPPDKDSKSTPKGLIKKRGRPPKVKPESPCDGRPSKQSKITDTIKKAKRTVDRFKGVTKEELMQRFLPDRIKHGLDILIIGINPGLFAVYKGHHYAGPGNHFWNCINMSGMVDKPVSAVNDIDMLSYGIGFVTIVQRTTPSAKDLSSKEIREGGKELIEKIKIYQPKIAVFNGKGIYEIFSKEMFGQKKKDFTFGTQPNKIPGTDTYIFVMPSSSARCAQFPRAQDKVHYYIQIKKLRDKLKGIESNDEIEETRYTFDLGKATEMARKEKVKTEKHDPSYDGNDVSFPTSSIAATKVPPSTPVVTVVPVPPDEPGCSKAMPGKVVRQKEMPKSKAKKGNVATGHPHLVKFLCQGEENLEKTQPATKRTFRVAQLNEVVSDEQRNERVGNWVQTQIHQNYESEPPMGYEERLRTEANAENPESDRGSQMSMVSAGVSGSTSTGSTSGYGSVDTNNTHHARQDRVEMWVREQQYVRQQSAANQVADVRRPNLSRPSVTESEQFPADLPARSSLSFEAWNNFAPQPFTFSGAAINQMEGVFRPPVPLYSSWGGNEVGHFSGVSPNINNNNNSIAGSSQLNMSSFLP